jgi:hypothetical protein
MNRNQGQFYQSPATQATQVGLSTFPYLAPPNKRILKVSESVQLLASPEVVWLLVGKFDSRWNPLISSIKTVGSGVGQLREIETVDGKTIIERLDSIDQSTLTLTYSLISGIPAKPYTGVIQVTREGAGSKVTWTVSYRPSGQGELIVHLMIKSLIARGLNELQARFGVAK